MGIGVGLIFFFSALVPLNFLRVQNLMAVRPNGLPWSVMAKLECISNPQRVIGLRCGRLASTVVLPIESGLSRWKLNSVVSCKTKIGPLLDAIRAFVAAKCPARRKTHILSAHVRPRL